MIRYIAVGEPEFNCEWFLSIAAINSFSLDEKTGRARLHYTLPDTEEGTMEDCLSVEPFEKVRPLLLGLPPDPLILDLSKSEQDKIRRTLNATQQTLDELQPRLQPGPTVGLDSDVWAVVKLLESREWAEHCTTTELGGRLETEITKLIGHDNAATNKLQRAEQLLAEIHHAVNNDGGLYPIGPDSDLVARLSEYLYPDSTNC
ncbi:hypothetical protein sortsyn_28 [Escherichia phage sortsyn]|uniref:Uncharacterized protein n=1 Tax=Escherichia phage sortsyn TaxID=2696447 RepID=A0A6B9X1Q2_9CAUD|nr:hypothetical protein sortsyn_28 [Escherichia phage sortsyn]